jgi:hypothetical protein
MGWEPSGDTSCRKRKACALRQRIPRDFIRKIQNPNDLLAQPNFFAIPYELFRLDWMNNHKGWGRENR